MSEIYYDPHDLMDEIGGSDFSEYDNTPFDDENYLVIHYDKPNQIIIKYRTDPWLNKAYIISFSDYWIALEIDKIRIGSFEGSPLKIDGSFKLSDFVEIVKSPFDLELSSDELVKYQYDFHVNDIIIKADLKTITKKIESLLKLKAFL